MKKLSFILALTLVFASTNMIFAEEIENPIPIIEEDNEIINDDLIEEDNEMLDPEITDLYLSPYSIYLDGFFESSGRTGYKHLGSGYRVLNARNTGVVGGLRVSAVKIMVYGPDIIVAGPLNVSASGSEYLSRSFTAVEYGNDGSLQSYYIEADVYGNGEGWGSITD